MAHVGALHMYAADIIAALLGIRAGALKMLIQDLVLRLPRKVFGTTRNLIIGVNALVGMGSAYPRASSIPNSPARSS